MTADLIVETEPGVQKRIRELEDSLAKTRAELESLRQKTGGAAPAPDLRRFLEMLPIPASILVWDDWEANYFNPAFTQAIGYSKENCHSREELRLRLYPDPDYRHLIENEIKSWESNGPDRDRRVERRVATADGGSKYFIYQAIPFAPDRFMTLWFDITERKKTEEKLQESNHFTETLISSMGQGFIVNDTRFRYVKWNKFMEDLTGIAEDEILGLTPWQVFPNLNDDGIQGIMARALGGETVVAEHRRIDLIGGKLYNSISSVYSPHRDREGKIQGVVTMVSDTTQRVLAEEALKKSEEAYRLTLDSVPDTVVITTLEEGRYLYVNDRFTQLTGYKKEEILGKTVHDKEIYRGVSQRDRIVQALREKGRVDNLEIRGRNRQGKPFATLFSARRIKYKDQDCLVGVSKDLTDLRESQEERERLEEQLRQAQKMEAIGTLAGGVAHDFNNILQIIGGYVQLLTKTRGLPEESRRQLEEIDGSVQKAARLVGQLLSFSRKLEPELVVLDLNKEILQTVKMLRRMIPRMIRVETFLAPDLKPVRGDAVQLEQVLLNLGSNASDAMPGGGSLTIKSRNVSLTDDSRARRLGLQPGRYVHLTVADTGEGIEPDLIPHIFDPFYTTKETGRGTGLGLAMAYGIITSHQGRILCESSPGRGATFHIYLPVEGAEGRPGAAPLPQERESGSGGDETILVVDDERNILDIAAEILSSSGYRVLTAPDGETALELYLARGGEIDLVVMDLSMPGMGGRRCLEEILKLDPKAKVIISSGYLEEEDSSKTPDAAGFIGKPYRLPDLLGKVRSVLEKSRD